MQLAYRYGPELAAAIGIRIANYTLPGGARYYAAARIRKIGRAELYPAIQVWLLIAVHPQALAQLYRP